LTKNPRPGDYKPYPIHQSALYKIKSIGQLADILQTDRKTISYAISSQENYIRFQTEEGRDVQWPKPYLRRLQKRAANLLGRIKTPDFLHSAKRGRSYITNAASHNALAPAIKVDVRKFFDSVRAQAVYHFFKDTMLCEPDVAAVLAKLFTVDSHLPTGGNVSPILSYFTYMEMFSNIDSLAKQRGCIMTCFIDDMTITGPGATGKLIHEIKSIMRCYRLWGHKTRVFQAREARVITGVAVTVQGLRLPNERQQAIKEDLVELRKPHSDDARLRILRRVAGRLHEAAQIDKRWRPRAVAISARLKATADRVAKGEAKP
jgi:RNA-directed DNA polymerase